MFYFQSPWCTEGEVEPPFFAGIISDIDKGSFFEKTVWVTGTPIGNQDKQFIFGITEETKISNNKGEELSYDDLKKGQQVEIWLGDGENLIMTSKTPQTRAGKIKLN